MFLSPTYGKVKVIEKIDSIAFNSAKRSRIRIHVHDQNGCKVFKDFPCIKIRFLVTSQAPFKVLLGDNPLQTIYPK